MVETSRAVLLRYSRNGGLRRASGLHVAGEFVLTADHCAGGEDHRVVTGGAELPATVHVRTGSADRDLAVLHVPGLGALPAPDYARVDRVHARTLRHCVALGFPQWKKSGDGRPVLVQLDGEVPTAEGVDPAEPRAPVLLSLKIRNQALEGAPPLTAGEMDRPSTTPWAGMSGAVLLTADDVVVGVVRSHAPAEGQASLTVTGLDALDRLPAAEAAVFWEALGVRDAAVLPILPPPLDLAAEEAMRLCRAQVTNALEDLAVLRGLDLDRRIHRASLQALRTSGGSSRLTALVGDSGYGKTAELGGWAAERTDTCLLLRGSEVVTGTRHLGDVVDSALAKVSDRTPLWTGAQLARALEAPGPLLVLLDGLNEIDLDNFATSPEEWLLASLKWLAAVGAVGAVACRPERWQELGDVAARTKVSIVAVGPFTHEETARAAHRYHLAVSSAVAELLRVPLAMRLYADVQTSGDIVSLDGLVETYLHDRCAVVARAVRTRPRLVLDRVLAAGKQLWESGSPMLSPADFDGCFPLATGIGAALLDSGLLIPAGAGYRFKFDDVSEWVQGQVLPLAELLREEMPTHGPAGPIAAAIRRVSAAGDHEAVKGHLRVLLAARGWRALQAFESALEKLPDASPYVEVLGEAADLKARAGRDLWMGAFLRGDFWVGLPLPVVGRLRLLRRLVPLDLMYGWREKEWHEPVLEGYGRSVLALLEEDPGVAADELLTWLGDATPLNPGEATVGDVAARLLWLTRDREPDLRLGMLANGSRPDVTERLIGRIARDAPEVAAQVAAGWLETPEPDRERPALLILNQVDHRSLTDTTRDAALDGLETLVRRGDAFARSQALGLLMRVPDRRAAHLDGLLHGLLESDAELPMWLLGPALGHADLAERSAVLTAAGQLAETAEGDRLDDLLFYLSVHLMTSDVDAVLSVLARVLDRGQELRSRGAHLASQLLWKATAVPSEQESTLLRVMAQGPDVRRALIVPLTSAGALADRPEQRERLLYRLVELSGDDEMMGDVAELLRSDLEPLPFDILRAVTSRLAPADLDWAVVSGSMPTGSGSADRWWDQVSAWIDVIGDAELGPGLRAMVAARRSGADRHDCWRAAMEALRASLRDG